MTDTEPPDLPCNEFVELVTDYLERTLDPDLVARIDAHLGGCPGCRSVLTQWHQVIHLAGRLAARDVDEADPAIRATLMTAFRRHHPA